MADEDITLDGKPLQSLRVADLKAALEQRNLPKSGPKNALIKRLKGALMLENLQRSSSSHTGLQPNSQIGEEMSQNSFIKQYLAKQQELLRQRLEREAQQAADAEESPTVMEEDDNDSSSIPHDQPRPQYALPRGEERGGGLVMGQGMLGHRPDLLSQDSADAPGAWIMQKPPLQPGHEEPSTPSPPRAVASLSVRVVGQPARQGLPPAMPRVQEKEGAAPAEPGSAQSVLQLSRSARAAAGGHFPEDSDEDEEDEDDESDEDEEWGPGSGGARRGGRAPPPLLQPPPLSLPLGASRSRRKLQPPQHIPPPQVQQPPMPLRHPTPPPSPPPELSFPLPDTPKQSPPDLEEPEGFRPRPGAGPEAAMSRPQPAMLRQDSDSSSRSSSPEPSQQRRPGPLSLLVRKMESEGAFPSTEEPAVRTAGSSGMPAQRTEREREPEKEERERQLRAEKEREQQQKEEEERKRADERERKLLEEERERRRLEEEKEQEKKRFEEREKEKKRVKEEKEHLERKRLEEERERRQLEEEKEKEKTRLEEEREKEKKRVKEEKERLERKRLEEKDRQKPKEERGHENRMPPWVRGQDTTAASQVPQTHPGSGHPPADCGLDLSQSSSLKQGLRDASAPPPQSSTVQFPTARKTRIFSDTQPGKVVDSRARDSGSGSDSDSGSDSSSRSSGSSSSSEEKSRPTRQLKIAEGDKDTKATSDREKETRHPSKRDISEPSAAAVTEMDGDSESSMAQSASEVNPDNSEGHPEESTTPKAFAARKISLTTGSKTPPVTAEGGAGAPGDPEAGGAQGRKRRWGSSTAVTAKKPSFSITTDSLKSLIPDIKVCPDSVVDLYPDEQQFTGDEEGGNTGPDSTRDDPEKGLKIRRTVTQVVASDGQENGQKAEEMEEDAVQEEKQERDRQRRVSKDKRKNSHAEETMETQSSNKHDAEATKVTPSDSLVRRSISQQKSGVSVTIDDPIRTAKQPSPPLGKVSNIIHISNLVRPFTLGQLKELLTRTGSMVEEGFWIDKIKSHCFVTYATTEEALATRTALHGQKWPQSNPKVLSVDFSEQDELDVHKGGLPKQPKRAEENRGVQPVGPPNRLPPLMPERGDRERDRERERERPTFNVRDQWAEREREMARRERTRGEREWDRDKIREFARPGEDGRRSRSRDRRRRERAKSKERKSDKKEKGDEPPAKLLDDLFRKTKAAPCIYWLPLTEEQAAQRVLDRAERLKERERLRKELQEEEDKKREEERKERAKGREKEGASVPGGVGGGAGRGSEGERERERGRHREADRRREDHRPRAMPGGVDNARRSRSRSHSKPRDRRR